MIKPNKKIAIIGSNGYLGRNLAFYFQKNNFEVFCYDLHQKPFSESYNYNRVDITDLNSIKQINTKVDFIFMFAAVTGSDFSEYSEMIDINEKGLLNLLNHMKSNNSIARLIYPSTRLVYKGQTNKSLIESSTKEVNTIYALNKLACENILRMYSKVFDIQYTVFRICIPYGHITKGEESYGTIGFFLNKAKNGKDITLYGNGNLKRSFTNMLDICELILLTIEKEKTRNNIYNIGGETYSLYEIAKMIADKYNIGIDNIEWPLMNYKIETGDTIFDDTKIINDLIIKYDYRKFKKWLYEL